jgi:hypothetical protein
MRRRSGVGQADEEENVRKSFRSAAAAVVVVALVATAHSGWLGGDPSDAIRR